MKKENGITLIALIITIIIMLILVAVTVSILINSGLIGKAQKAKQDTQVAYEQEQRLGDSINYNGIMYNSIDDIVNAGNSELHSWTRSGDTFTCSHCNRLLTMGEALEYTHGGTGTSSITADMSGLAEAAEEYDDNSIAETQTIHSDEYTFWRVLGIEDSNKDGNYETLLLTTAQPTADTVTLYGAAAYNNWIGECNRMAKELYGDNARGMTLEDVDECFRITSPGGMYNDTNNNMHTTGNFTTKIRELPTWNNIKANGTNTPDGRNTEAALGDYVLDGCLYYYDSSSNTIYDMNLSIPIGEITSIEDNLIFTSRNYWLASHGAYADNRLCLFWCRRRW